MTTISMAACSHFKGVIEDNTPFALTAGQSTILLGSDCGKPLTLGYGYCPVTEEEGIPPLTLTFMNPAEFAVSDCTLGIHKEGRIDKAGSVEINLSSLKSQISKTKFCILKVEAVEYYHDPVKGNREIPFAGGFFIEVLDKEYFRDPPNILSSWCYILRGTNKGRRTIEECPESIRRMSGQ